MDESGTSRYRRPRVEKTAKSDRVGMILSKLKPPAATRGHVRRARLVRRFDDGERVLSVIAPPGYGKTEAARQWCEATPLPTAWLTLDLLDDNPAAFWRDVIDALRSVMAGISDEPGLLLHERGPGDTVFLGALIAEIERAGTAAAVVLDGIDRVDDRAVLDGLTLLVECVGHLLRFVVVGRSDPPLPSARWRALGWLGDVREEQLRYSDQEAVAAVATFPGLDLSLDTVLALNARTEGWPAGLHLALLPLVDSPDPEAAARRTAGSDRLLADYLVAEVLDTLPAAEREVALGLSVLDRFDADLCAGLLGTAAVPVARSLIRRRLFLTATERHGGVMRFHPMFRELLEHELRWRAPASRDALHRRAAILCQDRGDLAAAYRHLIRIGDHRSAGALLVPLALDLVDQRDQAGLVRRLQALVPALRVDDASTALDLSMGWFLAGEGPEAARWFDQAAQLPSSDGPGAPRRRHAYGAFQALLQGDLPGASAHLAGHEPLAEQTPPDDPIEAQLAAVGARVSLARRRLGDARRWLERAAGSSEPAVARSVPALTAWLAFETGDLGRARAIADDACEHSDRRTSRPDIGQFDAVVTAGRCRLAAGDLMGAQDFADLAASQAYHLGWAWLRARALVFAAEVSLLGNGPHAAIDLITRVRARFVAEGLGHVSGSFDAVEAAALIECGRYEAAQQRLDDLGDGPPSRLLRARIVIVRGPDATLGPLLADRGRWTCPQRLEAEVLLAAATTADREADERMATTLGLGRESGWVSPFLGHGRMVERLLGRAPLERLHPALDQARGGSRPSTRRTERRLVGELTPREVTLLELLPTHLSYAQIGERLYLSINTVKSNLKSLYRKLEVSSRAEAVEASTALGLMVPKAATRPEADAVDWAHAAR
jgi:LuxR family maltose regulon positive regulatory protein